MSEISTEERVNPVYIIDKEAGIKYELDFCRESVAFAERRQFEPENAIRFPQTGIPDLFYYAFRMHHKSVPREKTDKLLDKLGGLTEDGLKRLIHLYNKAQSYNVFQDSEDAEKNEFVTMEL